MPTPDDNDLLFRVGELVRILTNAQKGELYIGRENILNKDYTKRIFVVDELPPATVLSSGEKFNGTTEVMKFVTMYRHDVTIDVYGATAHLEASKLVGLLRSQLAHDTKTALGLSGFNVSSKTDLKELTGTQYINRIQLACVVHNCETVEIQTMRIDTATLQIRNEKGIIYDSES